MESEVVIITLLKHTQIFHYVNVASIVVLYYDYFLTFNLEVKLIWSSKWNVIKVLFLLARYTPFFDSFLLLAQHFTPDLPAETCLRINRAQVWLYTAGGFIAETILTIRTCGVWANSPKVMYSIPVIFVALWVASCVLLKSFYDSFKFASPPYPGFKGCLPAGGSSILSDVWVLLMTFNAATLILMIIRGFNSWRIGAVSRLLRTVFLDGISYYFFLFVLSLLNVILVRTLPLDFVNLLTTLERVMHSIFACRVILHIRQRGVGSLGDETML